MLKTLKRKIALVAVAALGAGGLSIAAAPSAFAANSDTVTGAGAAETNKAILYVGVPTAYQLTVTQAADRLIAADATSVLTANATITAAFDGGGANVTLGSVVVNNTAGVANATIDMTITSDTAVTGKDLIFTIDPDGAAGNNAVVTVTAAATGLDGMSFFAKPVVTSATLTGGVRVNANQTLAIQVVGSNSIKVGTSNGFVFVGGPSGGDIETNDYGTAGLAAQATADAALSSTATAVTGAFVTNTDTAGTYQGVYYIDTDYSGGYTVNDTQIAMSFTTVGAPASIKITPTSTSIATSATTSVKVEILDSAGLATQLNSAELISVSTNSGSLDDVLLDAADLKTGSKTLTFTGAGTAATATITATPSALLVSQGVAAASTQVVTATASRGAAITVAGNVSAADAVTATQVNTLATGAGESYTYTVTVTGATANAPVPVTVTINSGGNTDPTKTVYGTTTMGANTTTTVYATADATGTATLPFVITEGANSDRVVFGVDDVANPGVPKTVELRFQTRAPAATAKPAPGTYLLKSGAAQEITVTVKDQFGQTYSNYLVRATSAGVIAASGTTANDGTTKISLPAPTVSTVTARSFTVATVTPTVSSAGTYNFTYSAAGSPATVSFGAGTDGNVTDLSLTTTLTTVGVPFHGEVNHTHVVGAAELAADFTVSASTPTVITLTATEGAFFIDGAALGAAGAGTLWNAGEKTLDVASGGSVYVYATKTGTHTITATAGTTTKTVQFKAITGAKGARNVAITAPASTTVSAGTYTPVTLTVTDVFGNALASATLGANELTATITGAGLVNGFSNSQGITTLDANGQAVVTVNALAGQSGKATLTLTGTGVDTGTTVNTTAGPSFGAPEGCVFKLAAAAAVCPSTHQAKNPASKGSDSIDFTVTAATGTTAETTAIKADVKAVSDTVKTLSNAVTTIQSSVTELTSSFSAQIKSLSSAIAKISRAIAALSKRIR